MCSWVLSISVLHVWALCLWVLSTTWLFFIFRTVSVRALLGLILAEINLTCEYLIETAQCFNVDCTKLSIWALSVAMLCLFKILSMWETTVKCLSSSWVSSIQVKTVLALCLSIRYVCVVEYWASEYYMFEQLCFWVSVLPDHFHVLSSDCLSVAWLDLSGVQSQL
jgi:hypothetical protein